MVRGWAPNIENINAAMKDDIRTSATPYCPVVSIKSRENAMPGKTLSVGKKLIKNDQSDANRITHFAKNMSAVAGITR